MKITITADTLIKASAVDSSKLSHGSKRFLKAGSEVEAKTAKVTKDDQHICVQLPDAERWGKEAYLFIAHTDYKKSVGGKQMARDYKCVGRPGLDLIKWYEGERLDAYKCRVGVWTVGIGHTKGVNPGMCISPQQSEEYLQEDLKWVVAEIGQAVKVPITPDLFDALASFVFNHGGPQFWESTLLKVLNNGGSNDDLAEQFMCWTSGGMPGLIARRKSEVHLMESGEFKPFN